MSDSMGLEDLLSMLPDLGSISDTASTSAGLGMDTSTLLDQAGTTAMRSSLGDPAGTGVGGLGSTGLDNAGLFIGSTQAQPDAQTGSGVVGGGDTLGAPSGSPAVGGGSPITQAAGQPTSQSFLDTMKTKLEALNKGMQSNQQAQASQAPSDPRQPAYPTVMGAQLGGQHGNVGTLANIVNALQNRRRAYANLPGGSSGLLSG